MALPAEFITAPRGLVAGRLPGQANGVTGDRVAPPRDTHTLVDKLHEQKGITITHTEIEGAGHFFEDPHMDPMIDSVKGYVTRRLTETTSSPPTTSTSG